MAIDLKFNPKDEIKSTYAPLTKEAQVGGKVKFEKEDGTIKDMSVVEQAPIGKDAVSMDSQTFDKSSKQMERPLEKDSKVKEDVDYELVDDDDFGEEKEEGKELSKGNGPSKGTLDKNEVLREQIRKQEKEKQKHQQEVDILALQNEQVRLDLRSGNLMQREFDNAGAGKDSMTQYMERTDGFDTHDDEIVEEVTGLEDDVYDIDDLGINDKMYEPPVVEKEPESDRMAYPDLDLDDNELMPKRWPN